MMFFYCGRRKRIYKKINQTIIPLQVHLHSIKKPDERTSLSVSNQGSMTVEAAMVLPILLSALIGILLFAKVVMLNQEVETALLETGRQLAREEHLFSEKGKEGASIVLAGVHFQKNRKQGDASGGISAGGFSFAGSKYQEASKEILLKMNYKVKIPLLLLGTWQIRFSAGLRQKAWNGYAPADGEKSSDKQGYVYMTDDGEVYHKDGQCYHLHITVHETNDVDDYYDGKTSYRPCTYCVHKNDGKASTLYIPQEGDCYHSDPSCGGLTRTVKYVKEEEALGRRPCSHCCK